MTFVGKNIKICLNFCNHIRSKNMLLYKNKRYFEYIKY